jgi:lipopolysaccharide transport system ATP-binding protein
MSADVVIRAEGLGKKYVIGHQAERERYVALRDVIARNARTLGRTAMDLLRGRPSIVGDELEEFWALKDVNFEIRRGEVVGVIGRNGAGKSTLLKVLSRITEPSEGRVEIKGRVASLLEVGTGFHPELSGRENIYLNGAILGMTRAEIRRKFDEIVAFSEIEKFLDTPVKRYSSGMYVRLAFAVAAHLEPEILIVDEVLAVGDAEFQKKCLGKMGEVAGHGRTVLFVSHNMTAVRTLCSRGILLSGGEVECDESVGSAVSAYLERSHKASECFVSQRIQPGLVLRQAEVVGEPVVRGKPVRLEFVFEATEPGSIVACAVLICAHGEERVAVVDVRASGQLPYAFSRGRFTLGLDIVDLPLVERSYSIGISIHSNMEWVDVYDLAKLTVAISDDAYICPLAPEWRGYVELNVGSIRISSV